MITGVLKRLIGLKSGLSVVGAKLIGVIGLILGVFAAGVKWKADRQRDKKLRKKVADIQRQLDWGREHDEKSDDDIVIDFSDRYTRD